jgi:hypothetical protein
MDDDKTNKLSDVLKKVVTAGIGAAVSTEDVVKQKIQDLQVSKELVNGLMQNAKGMKEDFSTYLKTEVKNYLSTIDVSTEIQKVLDNYDISFDIKVNLSKKESSKLSDKENENGDIESKTTKKKKKTSKKKK